MSGIARDIERRTHVPYLVVWPIIQEFMETVVGLLDDGYTIRLRGLGTFTWKKERRRKGVSIKTGRYWTKLPGVRLKWRPSAKLAGGRSGKVRG